MLSINLDGLLFSTIADKRERQLRIAEYLQSILEEAISLTNKWEAYVRTDTQKQSDENIFKSPPVSHFYNEVKLPRGNAIPNDPEAAALQGYYRHASKVLGGKHENELNFVVFRIGSLLKARQDGKKHLTDIASQIKLLEFGIERQQKEFIEDILAIMYEETAALKVFVKGFKAQIK
jgi:hypothetical protein